MLPSKINPKTAGLNIYITGKMKVINLLLFEMYLESTYIEKMPIAIKEKNQTFSDIPGFLNMDE